MEWVVMHGADIRDARAIYVKRNVQQYSHWHRMEIPAWQAKNSLHCQSKSRRYMNSSTRKRMRELTKLIESLVYQSTAMTHSRLCMTSLMQSKRRWL